MFAFSQDYYLWSNVAWSAAAVEEVLIDIAESSQAEVDYDWCKSIRTHHNVLWLNVPMHTSELMHMLESL